MGFSRYTNVLKEIIFALAMCHATVNIKGFAHALHGAELFYVFIYPENDTEYRRYRKSCEQVFEVKKACKNPVV